MSSFGNTDADRALLASLAEQVQIEVVDPMNAHGWQHGTPPPLAPVADNPPPAAAPNTPAAPARADNPPAPASPTGEAVANMPSDNIDWESMKDPKTGLYAGKYKTRDEFVKGIGNVVNMAKSAFTRADTLEKELQSARTNPAPAALPAASPAAALVARVSTPVASLATEAPKSEKLAKVLAKLVEEGGTLDAENMEALLAGISDQSRLAAASVVENQQAERQRAQDAENAQWAEVEAYMEKEFPRALLFVDEMALHVRANPLLARAVNALTLQGDHKGATEMAWRDFERTLPAAGTTAEEQAAQRKEAEMVAAEEVRKQAVEKARRDAGLPPTNVTGVHERVNVSASPDDIAAAAREMNATGLGERWRALTFGKDLVGPWFD